jgi:hypothetical protein
MRCMNIIVSLQLTVGALKAGRQAATVEGLAHEHILNAAYHT